MLIGLKLFSNEKSRDHIFSKYVKNILSNT